MTAARCASGWRRRSTSSSTSRASPMRQAAAHVRAEEIDILVNLNGYFGVQRMGVFARRPAPIQVNYLGFPATLGAPYMDYMLADRIVIPRSEQRFYDEKVVWLPGSYQVNDSRRAMAEPRPAAPNAACRRTALSSAISTPSYKLTPATFAVLDAHPQTGARQRVVAAGSPTMPAFAGNIWRAAGRGARRGGRAADLRARPCRRNSIWRG